MQKLDTLPVPAVSRLFEGISRDDAVRIMHELHAVGKVYNRGENIINQGDRTGFYWLVVSGEVHSFREHGDGRRTVTGVFRHGDVFGLVFAFSDLRVHPSTAQAVSDAVVVQFPIIDIVEETTLVDTKLHRRFLQNTVNTISQSALRSRVRAFIVSHPTVESRLTCYLNEMRRFFKSNIFDIAFDRQELADFLDVGRCALCTTLAKLRARGLLCFHKRHFALNPSFADEIARRHQY